VNKTGSGGLFIHKLFNVPTDDSRRGGCLPARPRNLERDCAIRDL